MQLIDFQSCSIWKQMFVDLINDLNTIENNRLFGVIQNMECHSSNIEFFKRSGDIDITTVNFLRAMCVNQFFLN